jgi:hypothetical protein
LGRTFRRSFSTQKFLGHGDQLQLLICFREQPRDQSHYLAWVMVSKLEILRALEATLSEIEERRRGHLPADGDHGQADREAAGLALLAVMEALRRLGFETSPLDRLNAALQDLAVHGRLGALFTVPTRASRPPDELDVQMAKAALAGIMRVRMECGEKRNDAAAWVARNIPIGLERKLSRRPIKAGTVADWYDQFSGKHGEKNEASARYKTVLRACAYMIRSGSLNDTRLKRIMAGLETKISGKARS